MNILKNLAEIKKASQYLREVSPQKKNSVLLRIADLLENQRENVLKANAKDLKLLPKKTIPSFVDRLTLNNDRISHMAESLRQVSALKNPLNEVIEDRTLPNGLKLRKVRCPLGVILMIFESRPNVAFEAFSLAFKSGNAIILRGGKESMQTTKAFYEIMKQAFKDEGVSDKVFWGITDPDRKIPQTLLKQRDFIDVVVPRGGDGLIKYVVENAHMPIIKNDRGLCHAYVHEDADIEMAANIVVNAKAQRPGVCNSLETVLIHEKLAVEFLHFLYPLLNQKSVQWRCDKNSLKILGKKKDVKLATLKSWSTEYLDLILNCKIVKSLEEAIEHIETFGSRHSETIVTPSENIARKFQNQIDAAVVYWNASTRFTDGFEFGLGGELGISTQKLHVRGPVGLNELTSSRWIVDGQGQIRK